MRSVCPGIVYIGHYYHLEGRGTRRNDNSTENLPKCVTPPAVNDLRDPLHQIGSRTFPVS